MKRVLPALVEALFLIWTSFGCTPADEPDQRTSKRLPLSLSPKYVEEEFCPVDRTMDVEFKSINVCKRGPVSIDTGDQYNRGLIDLHFEVLPLYVFSGNGQSGDYYAIRGYVVVHNAESFSDRLLPTNSLADDYVRMCGWYMHRLNLSFQLLSPEGDAVNQDQARFFVTPEPSTTIGATTYRKGFSFNLGVNPINLGRARIPNPEAAPTWKTIALGCVTLGFKWEDSSTQELPDQGVEMYTDPYDRTVTYNFISNNIGPGCTPDAVPLRFRTDQRVDFSFVWHVPEGNFCARDGDFGSMKMKVKLEPHFKADIDGSVAFTSDAREQVTFKGLDSDCNTMEFTTDLPSMNRIPVGTVNFKNTTRSYATDIQIWRAGEYDPSKEPYCRVDGDLGQNEEVSSLVREGLYDYVYELKNGNTGESKGIFAVSGISLSAGGELDISTLNGKRMQ